MNHHEMKHREIKRRRTLKARHLDQKKQLQHHVDKPKGKTMTKQQWAKIQAQKLKASHGTEDAAGRCLPSGIYDLPGMRTSKVPCVPKERLRAEATAAWDAWCERSRSSRARSVTAQSS